MIGNVQQQLTLEDHQTAFTEVCFLLDVLTRTIGQVVGRSTAAVGVSAGRHMAKKWPIYLKDPSLEEVLEALKERMKDGFDIGFSCDAGGTDLRVGRCAVRDVCTNRGLEVGGELCQMFHFYVAGLIAELRKRPAKAGAFTAGEACTFRVDCK